MILVELGAWERLRSAFNQRFDADNHGAEVTLHPRYPQRLGVQVMRINVGRNAVHSIVLRRDASDCCGRGNPDAVVSTAG